MKKQYNLTRDERRNLTRAYEKWAKAAERVNKLQADHKTALAVFEERKEVMATLRDALLNSRNLPIEAEIELDLEKGEIGVSLAPASVEEPYEPEWQPTLATPTLHKDAPPSLEARADQGLLGDIQEADIR